MKKKLFLALYLIFFSSSLWALVNDKNIPFSLKTLKGKEYLTAFIFTRCGTSCPLIIQRLKVMKKNKSYTRLPVVIFSVDPEFDTPKVLKKFRQRHELNAHDWLLLTGAKNEILKIVKEQFLLPTWKDAKTLEIQHSEYIVHVHKDGSMSYFER